MAAWVRQTHIAGFAAGWGLVWVHLFMGPMALAQVDAATGTDVESAVAGEEVWETLFDGTSLDAWRGYRSEAIPGGWEIEEGTLHRRAGGGDIVTRKVYGDFELQLDWKVAPGANSGIIYRVRLGDAAPYMSGPEYQVLDDERHGDGRNPLTSAASLYALHPGRPGVARPVGEWNTARIRLQGHHVEHWLNGEKIVECEFWSEDWNARLQGSKFREWPQFARSPEGHIALQDHGDPVWYREIKIRALGPKP